MFLFVFCKASFSQELCRQCKLYFTYLACNSSILNIKLEEKVTHSINKFSPLIYCMFFTQVTNSKGEKYPYQTHINIKRH